MSEIAPSTGHEKSQPPRDEKAMSLSEALEFLRSAFHYVATAGGEISVENDDTGWLRIGIGGVAFVEDERGDIYFETLSPLPTGTIATPETAPAT